MNGAFSEAFARLPEYLANHLMITVVALSVGIAISVPLAIALAKTRRLRWPVLTVAGVIQTIPSLALLALMVPLLGLFGFWPAVVALTLYSILPILRNTTTAIANVDPAMIEAGHGLGMTPMQLLFKVELPLAAPVILAGIRTATVWVVGIATLTTPVGQTSLGNYIFSGLQTRNWTAVLFGCVAAAVLAVLLDALTAMLETGAAKRSRAMTLTGGGALLAIVGGGLFAPILADALFTEPVAGTRTVQTARAPQALNRPVRIGSKTFTEQYILADLIARRLRNAGLEVETTESLGSTVGFDALVNNDVDVWVDYTGTIWANYMNRESTPPAWSVRDQVAGWIAGAHRARNLGPLGFENAYALAMPREQAEQLGVTSIDDLAEHAPSLSIGGDYEFFERPEWSAVRDTYGLNFDAIKSYDSTFMYEAVKGGEVDVISAFSTDGRIAAYDLLVLDDPLGAFPPYEAVLLLSPAAARDERVAEALRPLIRSIDDDAMRNANRRVDVDGETIAQSAAALNQRIPNSN